MTDQTPAQPNTRSRLYILTHLQMEGLARRLGGGTIGCSPLSKWAHGSPANPNNRQIRLMLADWMMNRYADSDIQNALPEFEGQRQRSSGQRRSNATAGAASGTQTTTQARNTPTVVRATPPPATLPANVRPLTEADYPAEPATPEPEPVAPYVSQYQAGSLEHSIETICRDVMARNPTPAASGIDGAAVVELMLPIVEAAIQRAKLPTVTTIHVTTPATPEGVNMGRQHMTFARLLSRCALRLNVWLAGPAGSGKTTAAMNVAKALNLPFYFTGSIDTEYKLLGFRDAAGNVARTPFRDAWENGGTFLFDECDGSAASALLALNAALANGSCAFPDGIVARHPDCIIIAAANTWGMGATFEYVGRTKLDAASMDRFIRMTWDYDNALVRDTCGYPEWADKVVAYRQKAASIKGHIISPRAAYNGARMLAAGIPEAEVIDELITPGLSTDQRRMVTGVY